MSDWQPIETAPKDGSRILTYSADAAADRTEQNDITGSPMLVMAYAYGELSPVDECGDFHHIHCWAPSHWMPLPEAPKP